MPLLIYLFKFEGNLNKYCLTNMNFTKLNIKTSSFITAILFAVILFSCSKDESSIIEDTDELPAVYKKIYGATDIYKDGDFIVIKATNLPDHKSPYYKNTEWENDKWEDYNGSNSSWRKNPNTISESNITYRIPLNPAKAANSSATNLGSIGVAINGVAIYNQYAGPNNQALTDEINSFDQYSGHPQRQGDYHYHLEPVYLTENKGKDALMGFLLDGFPVYGPMENGSTISNADLDEFHGHSHATADYPDGIYHYHITDQDPYINGSGFYGTPGTVTK